MGSWCCLAVFSFLQVTSPLSSSHLHPSPQSQLMVLLLTLPGKSKQTEENFHLFRPPTLSIYLHLYSAFLPVKINELSMYLSETSYFLSALDSILLPNPYFSHFCKIITISVLTSCNILITPSPLVFLFFFSSLQQNALKELSVLTITIVQNIVG